MGYLEWQLGYRTIEAMECVGVDKLAQLKAPVVVEDMADATIIAGGDCAPARHGSGACVDCGHTRHDNGAGGECGCTRHGIGATGDGECGSGNFILVARCVAKQPNTYFMEGTHRYIMRVT